MKSQYTLAVLLCLYSSYSFAQSGKYKREDKSSLPKVENPQVKSTKSSDNPNVVNIEELEQSYWVPQDQEFKVVQNRKYSKDGKFALSAQIVPLTSDPYNEDAGTMGFTFGYYFSDFMGVEISHNIFKTDKAEIIRRFQSDATYGGVSPDFSLWDNYTGISFNWIPIYGKMSIHDTKIIYYDLAVSPGIGQLTYNPQTDVGELDKKTTVISLDISQHFFFSENWAFRVDMKNRKFKEERYGFAGTNRGNQVGEVNRTVTDWQFGFTYYFDGPAKLKKLFDKENQEEKK